MAQTERTPLRHADSSSSTQPNSHHNVYDRFTASQKRLITSVISLAGIIAPFATGCFMPCVPEIAKDLNTTGTVINYTVGIYVFVVAFGNLAWAPYSSYYGRQPVYLASLPLICTGSIGAMLSQNVAQLIIGRAVQGFGASCVMSVGAATISDIYKLEERGTAMGVFLGAVLFGPALAPLVGGVLATYYSWRATQLVIFLMGLFALIAVVTFLPETSHPGTRGLEKMAVQDADTKMAHEPTKKPVWKWVWLNPFKPLTLLRGPIVLFVSLAGAFALTANYVLMLPLPYTLGPKYGIINPALIGLSFFPSGIGNMAGAAFAGRMADRAVIEGRKRRMGRWVPEDRLKATIPGALVLLPLSLLIYGLTIKFVHGIWGLVISLACFFMNGVALDFVFAPTTTYFMDILGDQSAEAMAVYSGIRYAICAIGCAGVMPLLDKIGILATNGLAALIAWLSFGLLWITIRYGDELRGWVDIGYTQSLKEDDG